MKRDIVFSGEQGEMATALGLSEERCALFDAEINRLVKKNASLAEIITTMNERGDLTDAEWTAMIFSLGYMAGKGDASRS